MKTIDTMLLLWSLALYLSYLGTNGKKSSVPWTDLPENMEYFCPSKTICPERNVTQTFEPMDLDPIFKLCCKDCTLATSNSILTIFEFTEKPEAIVITEDDNGCLYRSQIDFKMLKSKNKSKTFFLYDCSCDEYCGLETRLPCCYPRDDVPRSDQECVYSTTYSKYDTASRYNSYYMTSTSSRDPDLTPPDPTAHNHTGSTSCGQTNVAPWGSLLPVYSAKKGRIYKNRLCADEENVVDAVEWDSYLLCRKRDSMINKVNSLAQFYVNGSEMASCHVEFFPPSSIRQEVQRHICYKNVVNSCNSNNQTLPTPANMTQIEVRRLCESGFFSPYIVYAGDIHANIFCYICNRGISDSRANVCASIPNLQQPGATNEVITTLLDTSVIVTEKKAFPQQPTACPIGNHDPLSCRSISCPAGQIFDRFGKCKFTSKWVRIGMKIVLSLTPTQNISTNTLKVVSQSVDLTEWLKSPWDNIWEVERVYMANAAVLASTFNRIMPGIMIEMNYKKKSGVHLEGLIAEISETLQKVWVICMFTSCINASQALTPFNTMRRLSQLYSQPLWYLLNTEHIENINNGMRLDYYHLYEGIINVDRKLSVQKTHFCELIELHEWEFELVGKLRDNVILYKTMRLYLFEDEVDLIRAEDGAYITRICLEDAAFALKETPNRARTSFDNLPFQCSFSNLYLNICAFVILLHVLST